MYVRTYVLYVHVSIRKRHERIDCIEITSRTFLCVLINTRNDIFTTN